MTDLSVPGIEQDPIYEAAAEWLVRLQDPGVSLEDTLLWQSWMKEDARHAEAFARVEEVSLFVRRARPPRERSADELALDEYDGSVALSEWMASAKRIRTHAGEPAGSSGTRRVSPRYALAIAASLAVVAIGVALWRAADVQSLGIYGRDAEMVLSTPVGENRMVSLPDGSKVVLGADTRIEVSMSGRARSIELESGEAFFTVAKDPRRPFSVNAGDATIVAVGTEFNVRRASDRSFVSVVEGRVIVEPTSRWVPARLLREIKPKFRPVQVDAGQQTTAGAAGIELASAMEDAGAVTSWQAGRIAFRLEPLRYVLEDVNRYTAKPIVLDDESIGSLVITGAVSRDNVSGWITSLERGFDLAATEEAERIVIRRRAR